MVCHKTQPIFPFLFSLYSSLSSVNCTRQLEEKVLPGKKNTFLCMKNNCSFWVTRTKCFLNLFINLMTIVPFIAWSSISSSKHLPEKLCKYKDLGIEIEKIWDMKPSPPSTIPLVIGDFDLVKEMKNRPKIPGNMKIKEIQILLFSIAHILRRTLSIKSTKE